MEGTQISCPESIIFKSSAHMPHPVSKTKAGKKSHLDSIIENLRVNYVKGLLSIPQFHNLPVPDLKKKKLSKEYLRKSDRKIKACIVDSELFHYNQVAYNYITWFCRQSRTDQDKV